jgi:hypothetical protein
MKPSSSAALAVLSLCVLAACSPKGGGGAAAGGPATTITAADLPRLKIGDWEETKTDNGGPPTTSHACSDGTLLLPGAFMLAGCTGGAMKRTASGVILVDMDCSSQDGSSTSLHTRVSGDFQTRYVIDSKSSMGVKGVQPEVDTTHEAYRFLGPCRSS